MRQNPPSRSCGLDSLRTAHDREGSIGTILPTLTISRKRRPTYNCAACAFKTCKLSSTCAAVRIALVHKHRPPTRTKVLSLTAQNITTGLSQKCSLMMVDLMILEWRVIPHTTYPANGICIGPLQVSCMAKSRAIKA